MKKIFLLAASMLMMVTASFAQHVYDASFPNLTKADTVLTGVQTHGVTVDPYGRVWIIPFSVVKGDSVLDKSGANRDSTVKKNYPVYAIYVFNSDGSAAPFSPIKILSGGGINDTLWASGTKAVTQRGINIDQDGNILYSSFDRVFRINFKTGAAMGKFIPQATYSGVQVAVDITGNIFTNPVASDAGPIQMFDKTFAKQGNVTDTTRAFSRAIAVNRAGNKVYYAGYTGHCIIRYTGDPLLGFVPDTVLKGFDCESINRAGQTDMLWAASGSGNDSPNRYPNLKTYYSSHTWYLWNPNNNKIVDSAKWNGLGSFTNADSTGIRPRGVATTKDGDTIYVAMFGSKTGVYPVQRFVGPKATNVHREEGIVVKNFSLGQNYPNPFNPSTKINFSILSNSKISLKVYDVLGKEVATLANGEFATGSYNVDFNASNLSAGIYFYTLTTSNGFSQTKKMLLIK
jgi:hypothetical protein